MYSFITNMTKEKKYCSGVMKKHFNKEFVMMQQNNEDSVNSNRCWIFDHDYVDKDVKVIYHFFITG